MKLRFTILSALAIFAGFASAVQAQSIAIDEQGNYTINGNPQVPGTIQTEPFSGMPGLAFKLPFFPGNRGDIVISEQPGAGSDLVRFPGNGFMYFFSFIDETTGPDALADLPVPQPNPNLPADPAFQETGPEGNNFLSYNSSSSAFLIGGNGGIPIQYTFVSDGLVPEPSTFILLGLGGAGVAFAAYKRRKTVRSCSDC